MALTAEHAPGEVVGGRSEPPGGRQVERDDADLLGLDLGAELPPVRFSQARQAVDLLGQQHVAGLAVGQEAE